jgi:hypothetical protein
VLFASHRWKFNNAHDALSPRPSVFGDREREREREREHQTEAKLTQTCLFLFVQYVLLESVWLILCIFLISLPLTLWKKLKILRSLGSPKIYSCLEKCKVHFQEKELRGGHVGVLMSPKAFSQLMLSSGTHVISHCLPVLWNLAYSCK